MTLQPRSEPSAYIPALDGLRAIAVVLVVLRHLASVYLRLAEANGQNLHYMFENPIGHFLLNGWIGVDLFFLLSGYLISRRFFTDTAFSWRSYLARRALRILPAYLFILFLLLAGAFPFYVIAQDNLPWRIAYHLLFLQDYLPSNILVVLWSLGVEEKFYLLCPLLLPLIMKLKSTRHQYIALLAIILLGPLAREVSWLLVGVTPNYDNYFIYYRSPFHACIDGLFMGVLIARYHTDKLRHMSTAIAAKFFYAGLALLLVLMLSHELHDYNGWFGVVLRPTLISLIMGMIMLGVVKGGGMRALASAPMRYIGKISYSVYLLHVPLIPGCYVLTKWLMGAPLFMPYAILLMLTTLLAGSAMYYGIERPALNLKSRFK